MNGFNPLGNLVDSFYHAELHSYVEGPDDDGMLVVADPNNPELSLSPVCTSQQFNPWRYTRPVEGHTICEVMGQTEVVLDINPASALPLRISVSTLNGLINEKTPHLKEIIANKQRKQQ